MPFIENGVTTGLLGYRLKKEVLGAGLFYREAEVYNYKIYARPTVGSVSAFSEIETNIKNYFADRTGDITVKFLDSPADYQFPNDHLRVGEFNVEVELKKPIENLETYNPELLTDRYKGLTQTFFSSFGTWFDNFTEDYTFETRDGGINVYGHTVSFSLLSGGQAKAKEIANHVFAQDANTTLGINVYPNGVIVANTGTHVNYFNESYDLVKHSYSFGRRRETLPVTGATFSYDFTHSLTYKGDGFIDVSERGNVQGKLGFTQAKAGYDTLSAGAYTRCNSLYNNYKAFLAGRTVTDSLVNLPIISSRTFNKLNNSVQYELAYTNDSNISTEKLTTLEKTTEIEKTEDGFINISQNFNYTKLKTPISGDSDAGYRIIIEEADAQSSSEVPDLYLTSSFYDTKRPNMNRIKLSAITPNRKKQFGATFIYTNNPTYFVLLDGVTYSILDYKVTDTKPADIFTEYKVINRPSKTSVVNYAYQTELGAKNVSVTARIARTADNMFTSPIEDISANVESLYKYAVGKALNDFKGTDFISLSYFLSDVKYGLSSDYEITLEIVITYSMKKYTE